MAVHSSNIVPHIPLDTSAEAHELQRRIYAGLSGRERVAIAFRLSHTVRTVAMSGIRHWQPQYTESQGIGPSAGRSLPAVKRWVSALAAAVDGDAGVRVPVDARMGESKRLRASFATLAASWKSTPNVDRSYLAHWAAQRGVAHLWEALDTTT